MKNRTIFTLVLILIGCCLTVNILISGHYIHKDLTPDELLYNSMALSLLEGRTTFQSDDKQIDIGQEVTPFYPAVVAGSYLISNTRLSLIILNILLNCLTIIVLFFIIRDLTGSIFLAFFSALAFTAYIPLWAYNFFIMMEIPSVFLLTIAICLLIKYFRSYRTKYLYSAIVIFTILVLVNNRYLILLTVLFLILFHMVVVRKSIPLRTLIYSFLISILMIGPWFVRQYIVYDQFVFFTPKWNNLVAEKAGIFKPVNFTSIEDISETNILQDYSFYLESIEAGTNEFSGSGNQFTPEKYETVIIERERIKNIYLARLVRYFTLFDNDFRFMYPDSYRMVVPSSLPYKLIQIFLLLPLFFFSFLGCLISIIKKNSIIICLSLFWFSHIVLHIFIHYIDRYRLTILPVLLIISAYGFSEGIKIFINHHTDRDLRANA